MMHANEFPPYPEVEPLPAGMTEEERYRFAFRVMAEQGEGLGDYIFAATGVTDGSLLSGVKRKGGRVMTESVVMRASSGTVRWVRSEHRAD